MCKIQKYLKLNFKHINMQFINITKLIEKCEYSTCILKIVNITISIIFCEI